ncbi:MAG TPA: serine hydrolase [Thermomicrobiales bacterium]|nr:serine hydrolase [Thermomicrobiales bacterium]
MAQQPTPLPEPDWSPLASCLAVIPSGMRVSLAARHLGTGSTLDYDPDRPVQAASTIKTLILAALARAVDAGTLDLDMDVAVRADMRAGGSGVLNWLHEGISLPLRDHAWLMIAISDNTASNAVIDTVGLSIVQQTTIELGVPSLRLGRRFYGYVPKDEISRNEATARGLADLLTSIWNDTAASPERCRWMRRLHGDQQHRDRLPRCLPDGISYAGKTGTLDGISHDMGVIEGPSGAVAVAALIESSAGHYDDEVYLGRIGEAIGEIVS